ncbi:hypothetical protein LJ656_27645 [Paraburkholderia sp. MMS20-SJTR3]|uniref:DUF6680 domain-containing protein n=1 Tax=Paraburkholderia sejongensis TaxID=2886946 RepID=A0ABS8K2J7_9BURK|nr:DUF6680 family protein [Paraburkholderia sp. MMS20-SJTR3]MCC8396370.1 hypothetical protein [Paraburkholderia sp. MMS20-SJTR3]
MDTTLKLGDLAIVLATFGGPIAAVQIQKYLDRRGETNRRQVAVFRALMGTRATPNSPDHVNALNAVPLEFHKVESVTGAWSDLLMHLNTDSKAHPDQWQRMRIDRFLSLLKAMGAHLKYKFREAELQDHAYFPEWQGMLMAEQDLLRKGLLDLLTGKTSLPMTVTGFPADPEMAKRTAALQGLLIEWLEGKRAPHLGAAPEASAPPPNERNNRPS